MFSLTFPLLLTAWLLAGCSDKKDAASAEKQPVAAPAEEEAGPKISRDTNGDVVITMTDEAQGEMGILVKKPEATEIASELKAYGRVLDPTPLATLMLELATARAAYAASSNELARLKTLAAENNASARALQTAEATAMRDQLTVQSAREHFALAWGKTLADQTDAAGLVQSLTAMEAALVRLDLPAADNISGQPNGARLLTLAGRSVEASFLSAAPSVDPQLQGAGFFFLVKPNEAHLRPGESVMGYIKQPGELLKGVVVPREAIVRAEGTSCIYVHASGGEAFVRKAVSLEHPTEAGWLVTKGVPASAYIVVSGAQQLLSLEMKGQGGGGGD